MSKEAWNTIYNVARDMYIVRALLIMASRFTMKPVRRMSNLETCKS
jgi:hypothetical protein